ncbi:S-adenosylmethionine decarboxylase proenzyme [Ancylostoma caninum]|uniref:S-adenosylmethionine decarboxylase proenzyme n=2 Tax=Ancylostoma TaxID=29169 RepID=A0A368G0B4_ANCCA|nr:S-adenosylmethionine decarboxylase proenzyme [Ancylostoma caninum]
MSAKVESCVSQTKPHEEQAPVEEYFFEGAEKLLELWFGNRSPKTGSLRLIPRYELDAMLDIARCKVLHSAHTDHLDSYVLSESSLFVSERRLILKTCGSTRLLAALPTIIQLAKDYGGFDQVVSVYYSRKNFLRPELQPEEHRSFDAEVEYLDSFFQDGHAYCMGSLKQDRWYLYTYHVPQPVTKLADHTLEILMTDLDEDVLHTFTKDACENGKDCTERAGINRIVPKGTLIHEELFDPCGYSMNAFLPDSDHYATIHVTPEKEFSFASFETNQDLVCLYKQTKEVLKCFRPGKLLMTVFANDSSTKGRDAQQQLWDRELPGYKRTNVQFVRLEVCLVCSEFLTRAGVLKGSYVVGTTPAAASEKQDATTTRLITKYEGVSACR